MKQRKSRSQDRQAYIDIVSRPAKNGWGYLWDFLHQGRNGRLVILALVVVLGSLLLRSCLLKEPASPLPLVVSPPVEVPLAPPVAAVVTTTPEAVPPLVVPENSRPVVKSIVFEPNPAYAGSTLKVRAEVTDADDDLIQLHYRWLRNGQAIEGVTTDSLETKGFARKDTIAVEVTPSDLYGDGAMESATVVLNNHPPKIASAPPMTLVDGQYLYEVKAVDEDGDPLSYALEDAPAGMTIDSSGRLSWGIPEGIEGLVSATIVVSDGEARTLQLVQLTFAQRPNL